MTRYQRVQELKCWSNLYLRLKLLSQRGHWMIERPISWTSFKCLEILLRRSSRLHSWQRAIVPGGIKVHSCRLRSATMLLVLLCFFSRGAGDGGEVLLLEHGLSDAMHSTQMLISVTFAFEYFGAHVTGSGCLFDTTMELFVV